MTMHCTTCGSDSKPKTPGSLIVEIFLWLVIFPVGIAYSVWRFTSKGSRCRVCGSSAIVPASSPRARRRRRGRRR